MINMYITLLPVIFGGVLNMIFVKTSFYKRLAFPIDGGMALRDNRRIFGENKTWIGFFSMMIFCAAGQFLWGLACKLPALDGRNAIYNSVKNAPLQNIAIGLLFGLAYMLCELPNSFIKRRINITPGKTGSGAVGIMFFVIDQFDSIIGVVILLSCLTPISALSFSGYLLLGGGTHLAVNSLLYLIKIRKNI